VLSAIQQFGRAAAGPPALLMATLEMLAERGVPPAAIRYDDFGD